jgi:hypothetical protein
MYGIIDTVTVVQKLFEDAIYGNNYLFLRSTCSRASQVAGLPNEKASTSNNTTKVEKRLQKLVKENDGPGDDVFDSSKLD